MKIIKFIKYFYNKMSKKLILFYLLFITNFIIFNILEKANLIFIYFSISVVQ